MAGRISISVKLLERLRETEVDFLKKEYASFVADDIHGNPKTLQFEEYFHKVSSERVNCFLAIHLKTSGILSSAFLCCLMQSPKSLEQSTATVNIGGLQVVKEILRILYTQASLKKQALQSNEQVVLYLRLLLPFQPASQVLAILLEFVKRQAI